jgi:hypothetical protein
VALDRQPGTRARGGEVHSWCDEWGNPGGHVEAEGEVEDVAEPEEEGEADDDAHDHGDGLNDGGLVRI